MSTVNELTMNDSYLIIRNDEKSGSKNDRLKISYRKNLLEHLQSLSDDFREFNKDDLDDSRIFRKIIDTADRNGYLIYQLTRL